MSEADRQRWEARYRAMGRASREPSSFLLSLDQMLPRRGRALDLAGGAGRHALWLARRGLEVTLCDISETALARARELARTERVAFDTELLDLEVDPLPAGPWDLIVSFDYLQRDLFRRFPELLAERGMLVFVQPTRSNLLRHPKPGSSHLLEDGELPGLVQGLEVVEYQEGWLDVRHEARLLAIKP